MTVKERLILFLKSQKIGQSAFEKQIGLSNGYVNNIRKSIQPDKLQKISLIYPQLNIGWLIAGEGEMLDNDIARTIELLQKCEDTSRRIAGTTGIEEETIESYRTGAAKPSKYHAQILLQYFSSHTDLMSDDEVDELDAKTLKSNKKAVENYNSKLKQNTTGIPLIPINAMAGFGQGEMQVLEYECERYIIPMFHDAEFLIPVKGSSMIPKYNSGDLVACRKLPLNDLFFQWNKVYVLDTTQGALVKRVKKGKDDDHVLIVSDNKEYDSFPLHKSQINAIALVIGVIRLE